VEGGKWKVESNRQEALSRLKARGKRHKRSTGEWMGRKIQILIACWATVVVTAILGAVVLVLLGMEDNIAIIANWFFSVGAIIICFLAWPFYSKRMK
jgi:hypothetical protein